MRGRSWELCDPHRTKTVCLAWTLGRGVLASTKQTLPRLIGTTVVWSLGDLVLLGHADALVAVIAPPSARGRNMSVYGVSWGIAAMIGPILGTQLITHLHVAGTWWVLGLLTLPLAAAQPLLALAAKRPGRLLER